MPETAQITAIKPTQRDPSRATVRVGRRVVATLPQQRIAELELVVGMPWTDELATRVAQAAVYDKALRQAMNRLARRGRSRSELDRKLRDLGHEQPVRDRVLDRLTELNFLNDETLGRSLIREIQNRKPAGPHLLRQKLRQKGLDRQLIEKLVGEVRETNDQAGDAETLLRQRLRTMSRLDPTTRKRRLYSLLARRGFDVDAIQSAFTAVADELDADGSDSTPDDGPLP